MKTSSVDEELVEEKDLEGGDAAPAAAIVAGAVTVEAADSGEPKAVEDGKRMRQSEAATKEGMETHSSHAVEGGAKKAKTTEE